MRLVAGNYSDDMLKIEAVQDGRDVNINVNGSTILWFDTDGKVHLVRHGVDFAETFPGLVEEDGHVEVVFP